MYDRFGEKNSAGEINALAEKLREEEDTEGIYALACENGIDKEIAEMYMEGGLTHLCDNMAAAIGRIEIQSKELNPEEIMLDWVEYIKTRCAEDDMFAAAVMAKGVSVKGAVAELLKWSFGHQRPVDREILEAAGIKGRCTMGIPGMGTAKKILSAYYLGRKM